MGECTLATHAANVRKVHRQDATRARAGTPSSLPANDTTVGENSGSQKKQWHLPARFAKRNLEKKASCLTQARLLFCSTPLIGLSGHTIKCVNHFLGKWTAPFCAVCFFNSCIEKCSDCKGYLAPIIMRWWGTALKGWWSINHKSQGHKNVTQVGHKHSKAWRRQQIADGFLKVATACQGWIAVEGNQLTHNEEL